MCNVLVSDLDNMEVIMSNYGLAGPNCNRGNPFDFSKCVSRCCFQIKSVKLSKHGGTWLSIVALHILHWPVKYLIDNKTISENYSYKFSTLQ